MHLLCFYSVGLQIHVVLGSIWDPHTTCCIRFVHLIFVYLLLSAIWYLIIICICSKCVSWLTWYIVYVSNYLAFFQYASALVSSEPWIRIILSATFIVIERHAYYQKRRRLSFVYGKFDDKMRMKVIFLCNIHCH